MALLSLSKVGLLVEIINNGADSLYVDRSNVSVQYQTITSVQNVVLSAFDGTDSFKITYNSSESALITRGTNYTAAGIKAAIEGIAGFTGTVTVTNVTDAGFMVQFTVQNPHVISITSASGTSGVVNTPGDTVTCNIKGATYVAKITELTVNGVPITDNSVLRTNLAVVFG